MSINIIINEENCVGCLICQLWCSYTYEGKFIPSKAHIRVEERYGLKPRISFLDTCKKCGLCAKHCLYDALTIEVNELK